MTRPGNEETLVTQSTARKSHDAWSTLFADYISTYEMTLSRDGKSFTATRDLDFYHCSVAECSGGFIASGPATMTATRFH